MINITDSHLKGSTTYRDITFDINGKHVEVEVRYTNDEYTPVGEVEYSFITGSSELTDEEKDELDAFINDNY